MAHSGGGDSAWMRCDRHMSQQRHMAHKYFGFVIKLVPSRSGLQSLGRGRGSRLVSSLAPAPKYVDLPSMRAESARSEPMPQLSRGTAGWVPNINAGKYGSQSGGANATSGEFSKAGGKGWTRPLSSLAINSDFPTAAEAAKPKMGDTIHVRL